MFKRRAIVAANDDSPMASNTPAIKDRPATQYTSLLTTLLGCLFTGNLAMYIACGNLHGNVCEQEIQVSSKTTILNDSIISYKNNDSILAGYIVSLPVKQGQIEILKRRIQAFNDEIKDAEKTNRKASRQKNKLLAERNLLLSELDNLTSSYQHLLIILAAANQKSKNLSDTVTVLLNALNQKNTEFNNRKLHCAN